MFCASLFRAPFILALAAAFVFASQFGGEALAQANIAKRLIGTWRLVDVVNEKGEKIRGPNPTGFIMYDDSGNMAVQMMPDWERPKFALGKSTPEQAKAAVDAYSAYFGTYTVDEKAETVTHHRKGNVNPGDLSDLVRQPIFQGNRLILKALNSNNSIIWERASK